MGSPLTIVPSVLQRSWLAHSRQEYLIEFQAIAELETIGNAKAAAE
jgi:hypothetical protein